MVTAQELKKNISTMEKDELVKWARTTIQRTANRRITNLRKYAWESPALRKAEESGGKFSITSDMTKSQIKKELTRAYRFLENKTSTVKGYREMIKRTAKSLNARLPQQETISESAISAGWNVYDELKEQFPELEEAEYKYETLQEVVEQLESGMTMEEVVIDMADRLQRKYEEEESQYIDFTNRSTGYMKR